MLNTLKFVYYIIFMLIMSWIIAIPVTFLFSWLLFDLTIAETLAKVGGWWPFLKLSMGVGYIAVWMKENKIRFVPIPVTDKDSKDV